MTEWKLWDGAPPIFTQPEFFEAHPRIPGGHQVGYYERLDLVVNMVGRVLQMIGGVTKLSGLADFGCGDGTLLHMIRDRWPTLKAWGYDLGRDNVMHARSIGLDVHRVDLLSDEVFAGELTLLTEVLEHMVDPHTYLRTLRAPFILVTSPARESDQWHYEHHAWAWDQDSFRAMIREAGWNVVDADVAMANDRVTFGPSGEHKEPWFQCVFAARSDRI